MQRRSFLAAMLAAGAAPAIATSQGFRAAFEPPKIYHTGGWLRGGPYEFIDPCVFPRLHPGEAIIPFDRAWCKITLNSAYGKTGALGEVPYSSARIAILAEFERLKLQHEALQRSEGMRKLLVQSGFPYDQLVFKSA